MDFDLAAMLVLLTGEHRELGFEYSTLTPSSEIAL